MEFNIERIIDELGVLFKFSTKVRSEKVDSEKYNSTDMSVTSSNVGSKGNPVSVVRYKNELPDVSEYNKEVYKRSGVFLENIGYPVTPEYMRLVVILHELGHVDYLERLRGANAYKLSYAVENSTLYISKAFLNDYVDEDMSDLERGAVFYLLSAKENYADSFAFKNFILAVKHLREKGLIE